MIYWFLAIALPALWFIRYVGGFLSNLKAARATGLPYVVSPVAMHNPFWLVFQRSLKPILLKLPFGLGGFVRYNSLSWIFDDKYRMHQDYGTIFIHVTPGMNELHIADPGVNQQVFARKRDFEKPPWILQSTRIYGNSVSNVTDKDWQRHRRITAPPFNERNSKLVWDEAVRQTTQALDYWSKAGPDGFNTVTTDSMTIGLNVLATAALGRTWDFYGAEAEVEIKDPEELSYRDTIHILLGSIRMLILFPGWAHKLQRFLPRDLKRFSISYNRFEAYMKEMVAAKKKELIGGAPLNDSNFLNTLVWKSEEAKLKGPKSTAAGMGDLAGGGGLQDDELYANLFTYNLAGHETTANAIAFATFLLAANPQWQEWLHEEISEVLRGHDADAYVYEELFPRFKRVLALMVGSDPLPRFVD